MLYKINQYILSSWQDDWNGAVANKLHFVKPILGDWQCSYRQCRKDEIVFCHSRISHIQLTHLYILKKDFPLQCEHCQCILTVRHILVECNHQAHTRKEGNVLFNDTLNTFYLQLYCVEHMVKDHSDSERGNLIPPHRLLFLISSMGSIICTLPQTG